MEGSSVLCLSHVVLGLLLLPLSGLTCETMLAMLCHLARSQFPAFLHVSSVSLLKLNVFFKLMYFYLNRRWSVT